MKVCYLHKKRLGTSKKKAHSKLLDHYVDIEKQQAVCRFTIAMRSVISKKELSNDQANTMMEKLIEFFPITADHINSTYKITTSRKRFETKSDNIIQLKQMGISTVAFEGYLESLELFHDEKSLQLNQGLVMAKLLLRHYPKTEKLLGRNEIKSQNRSLAVN